MTETSVDNKVIRIQGDKLCTMIGLKPGTKIDRKVLDALAAAELGDVVRVGTRDVTVISPSIQVLAQILIDKIDGVK